MTVNNKKGSIEQPARRRFFRKAWMLLGGLALAEAVWVVSDFLGFRQGETETEKERTLFTVGPVEQFIPGSVTPFPQGKFYLVRLKDGGFLALSRQCTHLGCTVPWVKEEERFLCPCHASAFDIRGAVMGAPATRPLDLFAVRIENRLVKVDAYQPKQRSAFSPEQVVR